MTHPTEASVGWYVEKLNEYQGWIVLGSVTDEENVEFYALRLQNPETSEIVAVFFLSDDEGNNPGSFDIVKGAKEEGMTDLADSIYEDAAALANRIAVEGGVSVDGVLEHLLRTLDRRLNVVDRTRNDQWLATVAHWIIGRLAQFND